ncbi:MAG: hypothetical protein JSR81_05840 [Proteobacteria bacterium]|nr:hypothetical protein [Pseudomonadota bacterium]
MADDTIESEDAAGPANAALFAALAHASREKADAYLEEQTRLTRLQAEDLEREDRVRHWSLVVHHSSEVLKLSMELAAAFIFISIVVAICAAVWMAAHDDSLVIDAFRVPPDMAAKGLTGDVVASQLLDRLTTMQAETDSSRAPSTYASDWSAGIKVYIPNTSVSISDAYRYLANWLGSQTHISGEVYRTATGIAVTARAGGNAGVTFAGRESQLPKLMQQAAESIYRQTQPFRYSVYVSTAHPWPQGGIEQMKLLRDLALNGPNSEKPWAYTVWAYGALFMDRNLPEALGRARAAVSYDPDLPLAVSNLAVFEKIAGHDALAVADAHRTLKTLDGSGARKIIPRAAAAFRPQFEAFLAEEAGDWNAALVQYGVLRKLADYEGMRGNSFYASAADLALLHDPRGSRAMEAGSDMDLEHEIVMGAGWQLVNLIWPAYTRASMAGDWAGARRDIVDVLNTPDAKRPSAQLWNEFKIWPWLALADAHVGRIADAWSLIGKTPRDCYDCTRIRGQIDTAQRNWPGAAYWFAQAVHQAPDIPFAYSEWGAMLMAKGDLGGATAKFARANAHGPHFADPLEMWGEALIAQNRSDLALAKFADADRYAPEWGRLHLKWGEALLWSGDKADAKKQFAIASRCDLAEGERSELNRMTATHV